MNIRAQGRLLVKYELVTPNSLRDGAIQKSIPPGCPCDHDFETKRVPTSDPDSSVSKEDLQQLRTTAGVVNNLGVGRSLLVSVPAVLVGVCCQEWDFVQNPHLDPS